MPALGVHTRNALLINIGEDLIHTILVGSSLALLIIAARVYARKRDSRYLFLLLAFVFLGLSQIVTLLETLFLSSPMFLPFLELHVSHLLDFLMLLSFTLALTRSVERRYEKRERMHL
jgi:hypothetical protein